MDIIKLTYSIKKTQKQVTTSIAFYPVMLTLALTAFSWGTIYLDKVSIGSFLMDEVPFLKIDKPNTATSLLSSLLTGLISLVTFSFSMVMVVLTQVMSSFSPRLLPDLVSRKGNQIVMGIIMGTICFTIVVLSNIETMTSGPKVPLLSVVLSVALCFASLFSFIYFIHKISSDVQIGNIVNNIYRSARDVLNKEFNSGEYYEDWKDNEKFHLVKAWDSGYFDTITRNNFIKRAEKLDLKIRLLKDKGMYLLKGDPFLEINTEVDDNIMEILEENVIFRHQEIVEENFLYGFKHLTEIAVKALSPAVNDPGTAINAIDHLIDLFCRLQQLKGQKIEKDKHGKARIIYAPVPFETTLYLCLASIRPYSTEDVTVQTRLIELITKLGERDEQGHHKTLFDRELTSIEVASTKDMKSEQDINFLKSLIDQARKAFLPPKRLD